jgi:hypothetical protein
MPGTAKEGQNQRGRQAPARAEARRAPRPCGSFGPGSPGGGAGRAGASLVATG